MNDLEADKILDELFDEEGEGTPEPKQEQPVEPAGSPTVDTTKAFSERLKQEKAKMRIELAKEMGYDSWEKAMEEHANNKLLDKGFDPETVKPILQDLMKNDPDYIAAMEYKKEKQELEKKLWAEQQVKELNNKFGLSLNSVDDLDKDTVDLWNNGLDLSKAYAANHYKEIQETAMKRAPKATGTEHMNNPGSSSGAGEVKSNRQLTPEELKVFRQLNPYATDEQIKNYINRR